MKMSIKSYWKVLGLDVKLLNNTDKLTQEEMAKQQVNSQVLLSSTRGGSQLYY